MTDPTDHRARRMLLVTYWYPPAVGAAAERMRGFARHLPEHGWEIHVLTAGRDEPPPEIVGTTVHGVPDPLSVSGQGFADYDPRRKPGLWKSLLRAFVFPDRFVRWQKSACAVGRNLLRDPGFDLILASFPPASAVQLALRLRAETRARLVLDFRDRWFGPGGYEPRRKKMLEAHRALYREALGRADALVAVSETMAEALAEEGGFPRERIAVIPNGYSQPTEKPATGANEAAATPVETPAEGTLDSGEAGPAAEEPPVADGGTEAEPSKTTTIAHVGTVIARNRPDLFFEALGGLREHACLDGVVFKFVGNLSPGYIRQTELDCAVSTTGLIPRSDARREMRDADALLLLTGAYVGRWGTNAKLFEYIQSGRPILCLEEEAGSQDRRLLEQFVRDRAFFAPIDDAEAIAGQIEALRAYLAERPRAAIELDPAFREYNRARLAARLAEHLNRLFDPPPAADP